MTRFTSLGFSWPPQGWESLGPLDHKYFQAIKKEPSSACILGAEYRIETFPFKYNDEKLSIAYNIDIRGWEFNIYNECREFQILSFMFTDRLHGAARREKCVSSIKTMLQPVRITQRSVERCMLAAGVMMRQIEKGIVPEAEKILKLYKIHSSQRKLYDFDYARGDSLRCGLPEINEIRE